MVLVIVGALILFSGNMKILEKIKGDETKSVDIFSLIKDAKEKGESSGVVMYRGDICLDDFLPVKVPCREGGGISARHAYCFKKNVLYYVNVTRNNAGGVCIEISEAG